MLSTPERPVVDDHTSRFIIGVIAIFLANLTSYFSVSGIPLQSISDSYHEGFWARDIFVGFLFAISAFLLAYNGTTKTQMVLSKLAALAAIGVAMFPCECVSYPEIIADVHGYSAAVMFFILAFFCYTFFKRARKKSHPQARFRAYIYAVSGGVIVLSISILAIDHLTGGPFIQP